ncbi:MAG: hypothetical protein RL230_2537, partial [Pseudomonadota bacterium]
HQILFELQLEASTKYLHQLFQKVDVFIFDCDGVIWRVSLFWYHITVFHRYVDFITT